MLPGFSVTTWALWGAAAFVLVGCAWLAYLAAVLAWGDVETNALQYYGRSPEERLRFRRTLRRHALLLSPLVRLLGRFSSFTFENASFTHDGVTGPKGTCSAASFARAVAYEPRPEDVFVVTQMKSGTTWMQHLIYEILHRGHGDLVGSRTTLYAASPWLEARKGVPVDEAPLLGSKRPARLIKTHLPVSLCPDDRAARYVYVARHPVSCFASCVDFIAASLGAFAPDVDLIEKWFLSDAMWWGPWPAHVQGWGARARNESHVLFVRFEDMKADLADVVRRVAVFLDIEPLSPEEVVEVVRKCSFDYMRRNAGTFEMHPPHLLQTEAEFFVRGSSDRHQDVAASASERILAWCAARSSNRAFDLEDIYPDVAPQIP